MHMLDFPALGSILASAMIGLSASAAPVIIDISSTSSPGTRTAVSTLDGSKMVAYNEIANGSTTPANYFKNYVSNLVDTAGVATGMNLTMLDVANGPTVGSKYASTTDFAGSLGASLFSAGMMQSFLAVYNSTKNIDYAFTGLDASATYNFDILCNRNGTAGTTVITLAGLVTTVRSIAVSDNTALLSFTRIAPDANGRIVLYVSSSPAPSTLYAPINVFQFEKIEDAATLITIQ